MTDWLDVNVPEGEMIVCEPAGAFPNPNLHTVQTVDFLGLSSPQEYGARGIRYLAGSGREWLIAGKESFRGVLSNLAAIRTASDRVWSKGHYAIYRLRSAPGWQDTVRAAMKEGDAPRARALLERKVREKDGSTPFAWKTLADLREQTADTAGAEAAWIEASRLDSTDVVTFLSLATITTATEDWDAALGYLNHALRISPRDPLIHHNIAVVLLSRARDRIRRGDRDGARADWEGARADAKLCAKFAPDDPMTDIVGQVERMGSRWGFIR
jgi:tetratricopeptide (TPR) repeat protein